MNFITPDRRWLITPMGGFVIEEWYPSVRAWMPHHVAHDMEELGKFLSSQGQSIAGLIEVKRK